MAQETVGLMSPGDMGHKVGEAIRATAAVADGRLYIRGNTHLYCIAKK